MSFSGSSPSDLEIIRQVLTGDDAAYRLLIVKYQHKILGLCQSFVGASMAEDAAQEIFLKVYEALEDFEQRSSFYTWLHRIAINHCLQLLAKKKKEKTESLDAWLSDYGDVAFPEKRSLAESVENREMIERTLSQLSWEERTILILREVQGLTYQELAETLGISMDAVKVRLFRARKSLGTAAKKIL